MNRSHCVSLEPVHQPKHNLVPMNGLSSSLDSVLMTLPALRNRLSGVMQFSSFVSSCSPWALCFHGSACCRTSQKPTRRSGWVRVCPVCVWPSASPLIHQWTLGRPAPSWSLCTFWLFGELTSVDVGMQISPWAFASHCFGNMIANEYFVHFITNCW